MKIKFGNNDVLIVNNVEEFHRDVVNSFDNSRVKLTQLIFDISKTENITLEQLTQITLKLDNLKDITILNDEDEIIQNFNNIYNDGVTINKKYNKDGVIFNVQLDTVKY